MKTHLMHPSRDFDWEQALPTHEADLRQDLALDTLFTAMAAGDKFFFDVAKRVVLLGPQEDAPTVLYRQHVLKDCLANHQLVREIYTIALDTLENQRRSWFGIFSRYPSSVLSGAVQLLILYMTSLRRLRAIADEHSHQFHSDGFTIFFAKLQTELSDAYFAEVDAQLEDLKFNRGLLMSAALGEGNAGTGYALREPPKKQSWWSEWVSSWNAPGHSFHISERDEAGARALGDLCDRGINMVANSTGQSSDHIKDFFMRLRGELAFYLSCVNLHSKLQQLGVPLHFPKATVDGSISATNLQDACLALSMGKKVVGNDLRTNGKMLVVVTGANQGGKSTFLRSVGLAQLMMQCGMFVAAQTFEGALCPRLFTHYKREEDKEMTHGKFDEELGRMSGLVEGLRPNSMMLFNESFASTNEREGSEIAQQIVRALLKPDVRIFFVTHFYEFARRISEELPGEALFLRADRLDDGRRTFKVVPGEALETSFGSDVYLRIFGESEGLTSRRVAGESLSSQ